MTDRNDTIEQFVLNSLGWAVEHLNEFHPLQDGLPFDIVRGQRMSELATMAYCYIGLGGDPQVPAINRIIDFLDNLQRDRRLTDRASRMPSEFVLFSDVYGSLRSLRREHKPLGELLQRVLDAGLPQRMERPPHRLMDVGLTLELGGLLHSWPELDSLYPLSVAAGLDSAYHLDEAAVYALTHVIMFLFGFGTRRSTAVSPDERTRLASVLSDLIVCMCREQHWDLLTELLICWDCLDLTPTSLVDRAWSALFAQQRSDGAVPGPVAALRLYELSDRHPDPETDPALDFAYHYHTTLLAIIAGTLRQQRALRAAITRAGASDAVTSSERTASAGYGAAHPAGTRVKDALAAAHIWFCAVLSGVAAEAPVPPAALCAVALGEWICGSFADWDSQVGRQAAANIDLCASRLRRADEGDWGLRFGEIPPTMRLLAAAVFGVRRQAVPPLHRYLSDVATVLRTGGELPHDQEVAVREKRVLLYCLNLVPPPSPIDWGTVVDAIGAFDLAAGEAIDGLLQQVSVLVGFGVTQPECFPSSLAAEVSPLLRGLAADAIRQYDLPTAARITRSLSYLEGAGQCSSSEGVLDRIRAFLLLQQRPEGSFGFYGPNEDAALAALRTGGSLALELYLPVTVECVWALADGARSGWRLFESFGSSTIPQAARVGSAGWL